MATSRKLTCPITGKSYILNKDYYQRKLEEYGDEDKLKKYFITKKAKVLLGKGYSINEIRKLENVDGSELLDENAPKMQDILNFHKIKNGLMPKTNKLKFLVPESDPEVISFINNIVI